MPLYILRAHIILASVENRHEVIVAARADMASMILWMREEIIERGAEGSGDVHWVDWYPFLDFQALGKLATFDYPPISTPAGTTSSIVLSGDSEPSTVSGTVTAYMDPRPFCTQLPSGLYAFDDEKIVAAWLHWTTE
jgi:hypothetical protein